MDKDPPTRQENATVTSDERLRPCANKKCDRWVLRRYEHADAILYCCDACYDSEPVFDHSEFCQARYAERGPIPMAMQRGVV